LYFKKTNENKALLCLKSNSKRQTVKKLLF
jgi:hypothetical protein